MSTRTEFRENVGMENFDALAEYHTNPLSSDRERAPLAYAEEVTRQRTQMERVERMAMRTTQE